MWALERIVIKVQHRWYLYMTPHRVARMYPNSPNDRRGCGMAWADIIFTYFLDLWWGSSILESGEDEDCQDYWCPQAPEVFLRHGSAIWIRFWGVSLSSLLIYLLLVPLCYSHPDILVILLIKFLSPTSSRLLQSFWPNFGSICVHQQTKNGMTKSDICLMDK